jgi:hypothetical protein
MTAVAERPPVLPAQCVVLDEFLAPQELMELTRFTLEHESDFSASEVVSPNVDSGVINYEHRRSRVLMDLAQYQDLMLERIKAVLPQVLDQLGMEEFSIAGVEAQITASNDGDFFHFHSDNGSERVASRLFTSSIANRGRSKAGNCGFTTRVWRKERTSARAATRRSSHSRIKSYFSRAS